MTLDGQIIAILVGIAIALVLITYLFTRFRYDHKITQYRTLSAAVSETTDTLEILKREIVQSQERLDAIDQETKELQKLKGQADQLAMVLKDRKSKAEELNNELGLLESKRKTADASLKELLSKLDLYEQLDDYVQVGHFESPEYLFETSARFAEEIKQVRQSQRALIRDKKAIQYPDDLTIVEDNTQNKRIILGQVKLLLAAYNIECDNLIEKVSPGNFPRTLERIEKLANDLEKTAASLHVGFNIDYVKLKYDECRLQYQFTLKRQEEKEEQKLIREQMREEQKAIREYERAVAEAEKEERLYEQLIIKARKELESSAEEDRALAQARISELEEQLKEAQAKEERAKSLAEQTRRGHVYVISNIGSFGKNVYKIGLTRRLEPMDRVRELGDASVPFTFDVHAIIYSDDSPALEAALHREFNDRRVNAVNYRKEFFRVDLDEIRDAVHRLADEDVDFRMTVTAEEYRETMRLQANALGTPESVSQ